MESNFPHELAIKPSVDTRGLYDEYFIKLQESAIQSSGIAGRLWEAAYLIKDYVDPRDRDEINVEYDPLPPWCLSGAGTTRHAPDHPHVVVELGAGLGVVGFAIAERLERRRAACTSSHNTVRLPLPDVVVLTDLEDVCDTLLNPNLLHKASLWSARTDVQTAILHREWPRGSTTPGGCAIVPPANAARVQVAVRPLLWGSMHDVEALARSLAPYQNTNVVFTVVCSDLVYFPHLLAPLLRTLIYLTSPSRFSIGTSSQSSIMISYRVRSLEKETPFWRAFGAWFDFKPVLCRQRRPNVSQSGQESFDGAWRRVGHDSEDTTFLFTAHRRPETLERLVPKDDSALLAKHLDDTFESLLMAELDGVFDD